MFKDFPRLNKQNLRTFPDNKKKQKFPGCGNPDNVTSVHPN